MLHEYFFDDVYLWTCTRAITLYCFSAVIDLIYWTCWKRTAAAFGGVMFVLTSLICCTFISVVTKFSMAILAVAFLYRIGMTVFNAVQKTSAEHPFRYALGIKFVQIHRCSVGLVCVLVRAHVYCAEGVVPHPWVPSLCAITDR